MATFKNVSRRKFLKGASMSALAGAAGTGTSAVLSTPAKAAAMKTGKFNFDEIYDRIGTDSIKWDYQVSKFGDGKIKVGLGIADMDFRAAPCITEALAEIGEVAG